MTDPHEIMVDGLPLPQYQAIAAIIEERWRQDEKWGTIENFDSRDPHEWLTILMEEVGELSEAVLKRDQENIREEAVQIAAVALSILESDQRRPFTER